MTLLERITVRVMNLPLKRFHAKSDWIRRDDVLGVIREEFAKPLTYEEVKRATRRVLIEARENGSDSPVDYGDAEQLAKAAIRADRGQG